MKTFSKQRIKHKNLNLYSINYQYQAKTSKRKYQLKSTTQNIKTKRKTTTKKCRQQHQAYKISQRENVTPRVKHTSQNLQNKSKCDITQHINLAKHKYILKAKN